MTADHQPVPKKLAALPDGITLLLQKWGSGDHEALGEVMAHLYDYLHGEAKRHLHQLQVRGDTLRATSLVNEAYVKFCKKSATSFINRSQFFWFASQMIRHIIVDHIRARNAIKRQGQKVPLSEDINALTWAHISSGRLDPTSLLAINEAITELEKIHPRRCQIVTLRFMLGMSIRETADLMELSLTTVKDEWAATKIWLFKRFTTAFQ